MVSIPGWLISLITFPGVIVHEWAHKKFCDWTRVAVLEVKYFQLGNPAGYVLHNSPTTYKQTFWISVGPLIINSFAAIFLSVLASDIKPDSLLYVVVIWIAFSVGAHSFPSDHDASHVLSRSQVALANNESRLHYLAYPFYMLIWTANILRFFWFDFIYAGLLVYLGGGTV